MGPGISGAEQLVALGVGTCVDEPAPRQGQWLALLAQALEMAGIKGIGVEHTVRFDVAETVARVVAIVAGMEVGRNGGPSSRGARSGIGPVGGSGADRAYDKEAGIQIQEVHPGPVRPDAALNPAPGQAKRDKSRGADH